MKKILLLSTFLFSFSKISSQDFLGYSGGNYSGVYGIDLQPASIADSRYMIDMNLVGASALFNNNYLGIRKEFFSTNDAADDKDFGNKYLHENLNGQAKSVIFRNNIYLPSFINTIDEKSAWGFTWRIRTYLNVDGIEEPLAHLIYKELKDPSLWYSEITNKSASVQTMSWAEYGFSYARVIKSEGKHFLKVGGRIKLLQGLQAAYAFVDDLKYKFDTDDTLSLFQSKVDYGHSDNFEFDNNAIKYKFTSRPGFGFDLGGVYEYRPDFENYKYEMDGAKGLWMRDENKYLLRIGFSAIDIGGVRFKKGQYSNNFNANTSDWYINGLKFGSVQTFDDTINGRFVVDNSEKYFKMNLPSALSAQIDYNLGKGFFLNLTPYFAFRFNKDRNKIHDISTVSFTARYERKHVGFYLPVSYNQFKQTNLGAALRLGPLVLGTTDLLTFAGRKIKYGADLYVALKIYALIKRPKDRDKDKVSDGNDKCIDVPGTLEFMGCPDKDGDHVQDKDDACPDEPGLPKNGGCPDRDGDGILDKNDKCPDTPGLEEFAGCPDKDGDKVIDSEDNCPEEPGLVEFKGCPDKDGDKIIDKEDKCPERPGVPEKMGCPIVKLYLLDAMGNVLDVAEQKDDGYFIFAKLPEIDNFMFRLEGADADLSTLKVIINGQKKDAIKEKDGFFRFKKLATETVKGLDLKEVPDVAIILKPEEEAILKKAFDNLEFAAGKDLIKKESYTALDELAGLMVKKPEWRIKLSGHTDNEGNSKANMELSKKRANAVMKYLISKGVVKERIVAKWFGGTQPIADNKTAAGKQKNRRVEMMIIE